MVRSILSMFYLGSRLVLSMDKYYLCLDDFVMDTGKIAFYEGKIYLGYGNELHNEFGRTHYMGNMINWIHCFKCLGPWDKSFMFRSRLRFTGRLTAG